MEHVSLGSGQMFDRIAQYYDLTNRYLSLGMSKLEIFKESY